MKGQSMRTETVPDVIDRTTLPPEAARFDGDANAQALRSTVSRHTAHCTGRVACVVNSAFLVNIRQTCTRRATIAVAIPILTMACIILSGDDTEHGQVMSRPPKLSIAFRSKLSVPMRRLDV
jgi:hypothetical protein